MADRTITSISLNDVRKLIDEKNMGQTAADAVDNLLGLVLALSPLYAGPAAPVLLSLIEPKNEMIGAFKAALKMFSKSEPSDYLERAERMAAANCLLTYVAFFDAFRQLWPYIAQAMGISRGQAREELQKAVERGVSRERGALADVNVAIAHPAAGEGYDPTRLARTELYTNITLQISHLLSSRTAVIELLASLPDRAEALYQAEYLGMAAEFGQFFVWTVLRHQAAMADRAEEAEAHVQELRDSLADLSVDERVRFDLIGRAMYSLDLGLRDLAKAVASLPASALTGSAGIGSRQQDAQVIAEELHRNYAECLQRQVIDDQFGVDDKRQLSFPTKIDAFVPQAYRVVRYTDRSMHLEREDQWRECPVRDGVAGAVMQYLESPYSAQTPLLILGHPGSGKSLLTEMLAGQLAYPGYTTVRVKLRDVNPDTDFLSQLEEQVRLDTGGRRVSWADFATSLNMSPPVVILDGYDELLQATGQVFASFLDKVRQFQHDQDVQRRPVRVIVTSRVTLIDKAQIPLGTTVVRLEEFDEARRAAWVDVWNRRNATYFHHTTTRPFSVPTSEKLLELARQPLLLLMLAIYDSVGNELSERPDIDQTLLYDELLRRFVDRELSKGEKGRDFRALPADERGAAMDWEMNRLGVAATGMFNRQEVKVSRDQLNADLAYFGVEKQDLPTGRRLQQADVLLGSFFFVHESRSRLTEGAGEPAEGPAAFEFLHNTFGEFLAADFILRRALTEAAMIRRLSADPMMADARQQRLAMLSEEWLGCLVHTPLHTRPVILSMIREWSRHRLGDEQHRAEMLAALDAIVAAQLRSVLDDVTIPDPAPQRRALSPYAALPGRGRAAVYSLNLVLLRTYLGDDSYTVHEAHLGSTHDGCQPWDSLGYLWRSWFRLPSLASLAALMSAERNGHHIAVRPTRTGWAVADPSTLSDSYAAAIALADDLTIAVTALHLAALRKQDAASYRKLRSRIEADVPELKPVADALALKALEPEGDTPAGRMFPLAVASGVPYVSDFTDIAARLSNTPRQWWDVEVGVSELWDLVGLSRYEAETLIESRLRLEPRWLLGLLMFDRPGSGADDYREFLLCQAAAPVLRAAVRELDASQCVESVSRIESSLAGSALTVRDVDATAALAVLAYRADSRELFVQALSLIVQNCGDHGWSLLDVPSQTWEGLADALRSKGWIGDPLAGRFIALVNAAVVASLRGFDPAATGSKGTLHGLSQFWIQALRIGASAHQEKIISLLGSSLEESCAVIAGIDRKSVLAFIGWACENNDDAILMRMSAEGFNYVNWLESFLGRPLSEAAAQIVDEIAVASSLTYKEAMDLKWALGVLRGAQRG